MPSTDPEGRRLRRVVVAATSARLLAEAAERDGWQVAACDLYGDADTRAVCDAWWSLAPTGDAPSTGLDAQRLHDALQAEARRGAVGWVAGGGFDGRPELLEAGARLLPLLGATPDAVRRLRDPRWFFARLEAHGIAHPSVAFEPPAATDGWLCKDTASTGGWGVVGAADVVEAPGSPASSTRHWQRIVDGVPLSATFLAVDGDVLVLSHNRQWTCRVGARPHVHCGLVGPVAVAPDVARRLAQACRALSADAGLRGLASLDVLLAADGTVQVLEINPRPSASIGACSGGAFIDPSAAAAPLARTAPDAVRTGLFDAHLDAVCHGMLPTGSWVFPEVVSGLRTVHASRTIEVTARHLALFDGWPDCHDRPAVTQTIRHGEPVCSLTAAVTGPASPERAHALLAPRLGADLQRLLSALDLLDN